MWGSDGVRNLFRTEDEVRRLRTRENYRLPWRWNSPDAGARSSQAKRLFSDATDKNLLTCIKKQSENPDSEVSRGYGAGIKLTAVSIIEI